jgi:N-hydroxyarylamine O-acetyltransferase
LPDTARVRYRHGTSILDLDAYFQRIGYRGPREPTLAVLHALTAAHSCAIPFENLDVLSGCPISLDVGALFSKLVERRRGGYCFEQNGLFLAVLAALGFDVTAHSARVRLDRPRDFIPPRTHVFLRVMLGDTPWLTDVGVGGMSLTSAIRLDTDREQSTPHEERRIVREGTKSFHQVRLESGWSDVYEFTGEDMPPIDRLLGNWFTSTHPESHFKNRLLVARAEADGRRVTLLNDTFKIRERDGRARAQQVASADELLGILEQHFGLLFPAGTRFGAAGAPWPT